MFEVILYRNLLAKIRYYPLVIFQQFLIYLFYYYILRRNTIQEHLSIERVHIVDLHLCG